MFKTILISVYGVKLNFTSNSNFYLEELIEDYKFFNPKFGRTSNSDANIFFQVVNDSDSIPVNYPSLDKAQIVQRILVDKEAQFRISIFDNEWIMIEGLPKDVVFFINPEQGIYHGYSTKEDFSVYHMITDVIMNILSRHLIKRKIFVIHAAALSKNDLGILFPGKARSGKTTLSIILAKAGYKFLSDDYPLILKKNSYFEILAFPLRLKVRLETLNQFSEFQTYVIEKEVQAWRPFIDISDIYLNCQAKIAELKFIAFPILVSGPSDYERITNEKALHKLLPCIFDPFPYVQKDTSIRKAIFEMAFNLVRDLKCYNLFIGKDIDSIKNLLDAIFEDD